MDLLQTLQHLYARELNVSIASDWGNGFTVALGNERNGLTAAEHFDAGELGRAAAWLEKKRCGAVSKFITTRRAAWRGNNNSQLSRGQAPDGPLKQTGRLGPTRCTIASQKRSCGLVSSDCLRLEDRRVIVVGAIDARSQDHITRSAAPITTSQADAVSQSQLPWGDHLVNHGGTISA